MDKSIIINNIPSTQRKNFGFNNINKSEYHNEFQKQVSEDLLDLANKMNNVERDYNSNLKNLKLENSYLEAMNKNLLSELTKFKEQLENLNSSDKIKLINALDCENILDEESDEASTIDIISNDITAKGSRKESKVAIYDAVTNGIFLPESLTVDIIESSNQNIISSSNSNVYSPFDSSDELYFIRDVITSNDADSTTCEYIITLPLEIATNDEVNEIFIEPFLATIENVQVRYGTSSSWSTVKGFEYHRNNNIKPSLKNIGALTGGTKLNFKNTKVNQVKISLKCSKYTERESNTRTFTFGLKQVGVYYNKYKGLSNTFQFVVDFTPYGNHKLVIKDVVPLFNNASKDSVFKGDFTQDIYYMDENDHEYKIVDKFPFTPITNKLMIKCKFGTRYPEINIKSLEVIYKHVQ